MTNDKVHVGAGPGDPGLITVQLLVAGRSPETSAAQIR